MKIATKTGCLKNRGFAEIPEKHDIQKNWTFANFGGTEEFWKNTKIKKTGHVKSPAVPGNSENHAVRKNEAFEQFCRTEDFLEKHEIWE